MSDDCRFELGRRGFLGATSHAQKRRNAERMRNDEAIPGAVLVDQAAGMTSAVTVTAAPAA